MQEFSTCTKWQCRHRAEGVVAKCPECGARMETSRRVRILGWIMVCLGIFLVGFMGFVSWYTYPTMTNPGQEIGGTTYTGTTEAANEFFGIFALVFLLGLVAIASGAWQIAMGRRSRTFMIITFAIVIILLSGVWFGELGLLGD